MIVGRARWIVRLVLLGVVATIALLVAGTGEANAQACDGPNPDWPCRGYFYNQLVVDEDEVHDMFFPHNVGLRANNIEELVGMIRTRMQCNASGVLPQNDQNATSASYTVLLMLGEPPGAPKNRGCARFAEWEARVRQYDSLGLVQYNQLVPISNNSAYDAVARDGVRHPDDDVDNAIVFYSPSGQRLTAIQRRCGNMVNNPVLPPIGTVNPPTSNPPSPPGFNTGNPAVNSSCAVTSGMAVDPRRPGFAVPIRVTYSSGGANLGTANGTANLPGNRFQIDNPASVRGSLTPVLVTVTGTDSTGQQFALGGSPFTVGPCVLPNPGCGGMTVVPDYLDPATPYRVTVRVTYGSAAEAAAIRAQAGFRMYISIRGPNVNFTDNNVVNDADSSLAVSGQTISATVNMPATGAVGTYYVGWGVSAALGAADCGGDGTVIGPEGNPNPPQTFVVANRPYFSVRGGDVMAGARMSVSGAPCNVAPGTGAGISSWNRGAGGGYGGAGTGIAAMALGRLQDFTTAQGSGQPPSFLAFANNADGGISAGDGLYGGRFGSGCINDYLTGVPAAQLQPDTTVAGRALPDCDTTNDSQCRQSLYVNGDAYITGNITYDGAYAASAAVPSFRLIVRGNIYVAPGVIRLDGIYIAQPSTATATDGNFYSCANGFTPPVLGAAISAACNTPLTVNGLVSARQLWLLRTAGSVGNATAAETFNNLPETWISGLYGGSAASSVDEYEAITGLPPVL